MKAILILLAMVSALTAQEPNLKVSLSEEQAHLTLQNAAEGSFWMIESSGNLTSWNHVQSFEQGSELVTVNHPRQLWEWKYEYFRACEVPGVLTFSPDLFGDRVVQVDDTNETDNVEIYSCVIEARGSDINIDRILFRFEGQWPSGIFFDDIVNSVTLCLDGVEVDRVNVSSAYPGIIFEDLDYLMEEGEKFVLQLKLDLNPSVDNYPEGISIGVHDGKVYYDSGPKDQFLNIESGDTLSLFTKGLQLEPISIENARNAEGAQVMFQFEFKATAFGGDMFVHSSNVLLDKQGNYGAFLKYWDYSGGSIGITTDFTSSADIDPNGNRIVREGQTETFTIMILVRSENRLVVKVGIGDIRASCSIIGPTFDFPGLGDFASEAVVVGQ